MTGNAAPARRAYSIAMVSDFFYPKSGGVESHILNLSKSLIDRGHRVIIITRAHRGVQGVKYLENNLLKVYYLITRLVPMGATLPSVLTTLPILAAIFEREEIDIVHGHQSTSTLALEGILHAKLMNMHTCFTDHSILRMGTAEGVLATTSLKFATADVDGMVCVSYAAKENTGTRTTISPSQIHVIPNAVIPDEFLPDYSRLRREDEIVVVVVSRLVFRKGADLLLSVIPAACRMEARLKFIVAGDGDMREQLEQMRDINDLGGRVRILGNINYREIRSVLVQGDIFLNTSLTEAFCIAIIEGASCGLYVVSTDVGGVREVLPENMVTLVAPKTSSILDGIRDGITKLSGYDKRAAHERVREMYSWPDIARRTEKIYRRFAVRSRSETECVKDMLERREAEFTIIFKLLLAYNFLLLRLLRRCGWLESEGPWRRGQLRKKGSPE